MDAHTFENVVDVSAGVDVFIRQINDTYHQVKSEFRECYNTRENPYFLLEKDSLYETSQLKPYRTKSVIKIILEQAHRLIHNEIYSDEWSTYDAVEFTPNEFTLTVLDDGVLTTGITQVDETTVEVDGCFTISFPFTIDFLTEFDKSRIVIIKTEDGIETELTVLSQSSQLSQEVSADCIERLLSTTRTRKEKEAYLIASASDGCVSVAAGVRNVALVESGGHLLKSITQFPIDYIIWAVAEDGTFGEYSDLQTEYSQSELRQIDQYVFNTELTTREAVLQQLEDIDWPVQTADSVRDLGVLLGYPEPAVEHFSNRISDGVPVYAEYLLKLFFKLLENEAHVTESELESTKFIQYVPKLETLESNIEHAQEYEDAIVEFFTEYGLDEEFAPSKKYGASDLSETFEEFWDVDEASVIESVQS